MRQAQTRPSSNFEMEEFKVQIKDALKKAIDIIETIPTMS